MYFSKLLFTYLLVRASVWAKSSCRCIPGDSCWPAPAEWDALNRTVGGRLVATVLLAHVCHDPIYNATACEAVKAGWIYPQEHFASPSSFLVPYYQNQTCDPFTPREKPCTLGNYVVYAIDVKTAGDVAAGLCFAREKNVRVVIKNTGHDYLGRSTGHGALGLWTHNLKDITFSDYNSSTYTGKAIKMGAGVEAFDAYAAAHANGLRVVGGECPTVGLVGGYTQGGGHSALSSTYGLGADQTLEWEVVTADGELVVASPEQNADLYWALSGGGPGNYGVVLSLTAKAHVDGAVGGATLVFANTDPSSAVFWTAVEAWHAGLAPIVDSGVMLLYSMTNQYFVMVGLTAPDKSIAEVNSLLKPFTTTLARLNISYVANVTSLPDYYTHFNAYFGPLPYGTWPGAQTTGGRLIPRSVTQNNQSLAALGAAVRTIVDSNITFSGIALSVAHDVAANTAASNAVLPAWRDALISVCLLSPWNFSAPVAENLVRQRAMAAIVEPSLRRLTPGGGTYMNEANFEDPHWQEDFYGANYERLRAVKSRWDRAGLLYARTAVGSEAWAVDDEGRLCGTGVR